jgi:hypothetical protein
VLLAIAALSKLLLPDQSNLSFNRLHNYIAVLLLLLPHQSNFSFNILAQELLHCFEDRMRCCNPVCIELNQQKVAKLRPTVAANCLMHLGLTAYSLLLQHNMSQNLYWQGFQFKALLFTAFDAEFKNRTKVLRIACELFICGYVSLITTIGHLKKLEEECFPKI